PQAEEAAELSGLRHGLRLRNAAVPQPVGIYHAHEQRGHIVQHDGDNHFILATVDLQQAGNQGPEAASHGAAHQTQENGGQSFDPALGGNVAADDGAHQELALTTQVEHAAAVCKAGAQAGEDQRRGAGQGGAYVPQAAEGTDPKGLQRHKGIGTQHGHDDA
ncbi:23S rRNA (pseudouridine(1915)-N(3))-methyltransferase RlmH, partial [Dysosmobacter welbionis]